MLYGANAVEISDIQEGETEARDNRRSEFVVANHKLLIFPRFTVAPAGSG